MEAWVGGKPGERAQDREPSGGEGLGPLFARYAPLALRLARGIVPHGDQAEDVVQEAARAVLERSAAGAERFVSAEHARNYFLRAVHSRALDVVRVSERERVASPESAEPAGPVERERLLALEEHETRSLSIERLRRALEQLRPAEREAVRMRYLEGLAFREIARRTGASISTLHSRVAAGLEKLRTRMDSRSG